jgi:diguanylate cyclase (GGDEF)-like protein
MKGEHTVAPVALLMIDIDRFKQFNDSYGHPEGDACLRAVGAAIARIAGEVGGFAARYGGEEFAVLLPGADAERAMQAGELVRAGIEALGVPHRGSLAGHVTASVGVASVVPGAGGDPAMLIEAADHGLYAAKRRGRNAVVLHGAIVPVDVGVALAG